MGFCPLFTIYMSTVTASCSIVNGKFHMRSIVTCTWLYTTDIKILGMRICSGFNLNYRYLYSYAELNRKVVYVID